MFRQEAGWAKRVWVVLTLVAGVAACSGGPSANEDNENLGDWPTELLSPFPPFPELNGRVVAVDDRSALEHQDLVVHLTYRKPDPVLPVMQTYLQRLVAAGFKYGEGSDVRDGSVPIDLVYCGAATGPFGMCEANLGGVQIGQFKSGSTNASISLTWTYNP